jgi:hypothetical protein
MPRFFRALFSFIILTFILISCTQIKPSPVFPVDQPVRHDQIVYIDPTFTLEEQAQIRLAGAEWTHATRGMVVFHFLIDPNLDTNAAYPALENRLIRLSIFSPFMQNEDRKAQALVLGATATYPTSPNFTIVVAWERLDTSMPKFQGVIIHELGHSLGLEHINQCPSIMNSSVYWKYDHLSRYDLKQFCDKDSCDVDQLNYFNYPEIQNCSY